MQQLEHGHQLLQRQRKVSGEGARGRGFSITTIPSEGDAEARRALQNPARSFAMGRITERVRNPRVCKEKISSVNELRLTKKRRKAPKRGGRRQHQDCRSQPAPPTEIPEDQRGDKAADASQGLRIVTVTSRPPRAGDNPMFCKQTFPSQSHTQIFLQKLPRRQESPEWSLPV